MSSVNSVLGTIDSSKLGFTLMHEHLLVANAGISQYYPQLLGDDLINRLIVELIKAKQGGIDTIFDVTPHDLGRDPVLMAKVARQSGVNIIACTGWYTNIPFFFNGLSPDKLADMFVREINIGIGDTGIKAGIFKGASDIRGVTAPEEMILRAIARAHLQTKMPIVLHSYARGEVARRQIEILTDEGVDLNRVKIEHCNDTTDLSYLNWILEKGCRVGMDRYPGPPSVSPLERTKTLKSLIDAGWSDRIILSHDWTLAYIPRDDMYWLQSGLHNWEFAYLFNQKLRDETNPHGLLYIKKVVFPMLREMGLGENLIHKICVDNVRKFIEGN